MSKKEKNILIISGIIIIIIIGFIVLILLTTHKEEAPRNVEDVINTINEINAVFNSENDIVENSIIQNQSNTECYEYIGKDIDKYIEKIKDVYLLPFDVDGTFPLRKIENTNEKILNFCKPKSCEVEPIEDYSVIHGDKEVMVVQIGTTEQVMRKDENGVWKFVFPIVNCKESDSISNKNSGESDSSKPIEDVTYNGYYKDDMNSIREMPGDIKVNTNE